jgi:hypothetical protein
MSANYVILAFWVQSLPSATGDMVEKESENVLIVPCAQKIGHRYSRQFRSTIGSLLC